LFDRKDIRSRAARTQPSLVHPFERLISLDAYRHRKTSAASASVALSRLEDLRPSLPANFIQDHRLAFLSSSEHHSARALCLLLNNRPLPAALHHLSALLFRTYAESAAISRLRFIWAHLGDKHSQPQTVHVNSTLFFRAAIEAFYHEHSREVQGEAAGRYSVVDNAGSIVELFFSLGHEQRYNAVLETYNASLRSCDEENQQLVERQNAPITNR
jgi:hypothetical protein